ncbi:TetR/AcrR family transcriptional regulator [Albidovulum sediminicola]|uniref:TetR/AcrR family transcriptional regulator n=1 Tax=Albidovulum sediminicola TaxID=2984331 RepID=A0ABT2Z476_9RHOB|nr:TetR/AcrR family transcriptional regulator [Defluviimonas sp. WL0075]MCV2865911.1 TetR/AcrR family transcriptional regulator [Defluviimonas sp. WL0075]
MLKISQPQQSLPSPPSQSASDSDSGLRSRKKTRRRQEILSAASALFAEKGINATTIAEIAEAVGISSPTIFNYFGGKDGILIALITEGAQKSREFDLTTIVRGDADFPTMLVDLFSRCADGSLRIASKRIWRYAEAASIRRPRSELAREYAIVEHELMHLIADFFDLYDLKLRSGGAASPLQLAQLFYDVWNAAFFRLIKDDGASLAQHQIDLHTKLEPLARMIFTDDFLAVPTLKAKRIADDAS